MGSSALAYGAAPGLAYSSGLAYGAAPALAYGAAAPAIGSTYHGNYGAPALSYGAAPALAYGGAVGPAVTTQHQNILRSYGNLGQVSTYSRTIDTPYSSSSKSDVRVSNPGVRTIAAAPALAYGVSPVLRSAVASPGLAYGAGSLLSSAPALAYGARSIGAPALGYSAGLGVRGLGVGGLGVAYSAAPIASHVNYASAIANYGW